MPSDRPHLALVPPPGALGPRDSQDPHRFFNRDVSWLDFNRRVLSEATGDRNPLGERIKFLSISADNLDEFIVVRVAGIEARKAARVRALTDDGLTPEQHLGAVNQGIASLMRDQQTAWARLRTDLAREGVTFLAPDELTREDATWLEGHLLHNVLPALTPLAVDPTQPFPFLPTGSLALILKVRDSAASEGRLIILPLPSHVGRFIPLPSVSANDQARRFVLLEEAVRHVALDRLLPGCLVDEEGLFWILRDSEIRLPDAHIDRDFVGAFETAVRSRYRGALLRLGVTPRTSPALRAALRAALRVTPERLIVAGGLLRLADLRHLALPPRADFFDPPLHPRVPAPFAENESNLFAALAEHEVVLHHPYDSFESVVRFVRQAAADPDVVAIKQTLYRTSRDSPIVKALMDAAQAGKAVTAVVEIKARFDEEANLHWARDLERAGAQVVFGFRDLKTHAKVSLVVRREGGTLHSYVHFGTGNYHPETARVYTDLSFFTTDPALCADASALLNYMTSCALPAPFARLAASPLTLRRTLLDLIEAESAHARAGRPAWLWAKMNALVDPELIDALYAASQAGVQMDLIVRGACCLRPGIPDRSPTIRVKSVVGRFLEHGRMVAFGGGQPLGTGEPRVYLSSADWMPRNLDRRIEALVPLDGPDARRAVLGMMETLVNDTAHSWTLESDGSWHRVRPGSTPCDAYRVFMDQADEETGDNEDSGDAP